METNKGTVWTVALFPVLGHFPHDTHALYLIFTTTLRDTVVSGLQNAQLLARSHEAPGGRDGIGNQSPERICLLKHCLGEQFSKEVDDLIKREKGTGAIWEELPVMREKVAGMAVRI